MTAGSTAIWYRDMWIKQPCVPKLWKPKAVGTTPSNMNRTGRLHHRGKGSVSVNSVSLTVVNSKPKSFQVAIIPFTYEVTNFHQIKKGTVVNIEFDILGKYIAKILKQQLGK